jgi:succinate dehydrogenase / fumarate reductase cytochrome b subunit
MPYTGLLLLIFVIIHLLNFHFIEKNDTTIFQIVTDTFAKPGYIAMYVAAMIVVAIHVSHGFWSAFQTIGANHPKYMPVIRGLSIVFSIALGVGFGFIPIYFSFIA